MKRPLLLLFQNRREREELEVGSGELEVSLLRKEDTNEIFVSVLFSLYKV